MHRRQFLTALAGARLVRGQERVDREEVWRQYVEWSTARPQQGLMPGENYREWLLSHGVPMHEADRQAHIIRNRLFSKPDAWSQWFDRAYENADVVFEGQPNELLVNAVEGVTPGKALDVAMGQGRNAVYLAKQGWDVTGFGASDVGLRVAEANAERAGVLVATVLAGYDSFDYGRKAWDLVVMVYGFVPLKERLVARIVNSLKSGGLLVYEHLMSGEETDLWVTLGAIGMPHPGELKERFADLEVLRHEEVRARADWGPVEPVPLARLVARKP